MKTEYEDHPLASVLPMMSRVELDELAADIQGSGLREAVTLYEGKILDGRNRYRACRLGGVEPRFREFNGDGDPVDFILSVNVKRRHLTASQKALVIAKILDLPRGNPTLSKSAKTPTNSKSAQSAELRTIARAAEEIDVSPRTVGQAKQVLRDAPKRIVAEVEQGRKSVATAVKEIKEIKEQPPVVLDKTNYPIPESVLEDWNRADSQKDLLRKISDVRSALKSLFEDKDVIVAEITNSTIADLNNAYTSLKCVIPYAVCTSCQGHQRKKCNLCKGRGFLSEFAWRSFVPAETKKLRERAVQK